jgi:hypothetical protein
VLDFLDYEHRRHVCQIRTLDDRLVKIVVSFDVRHRGSEKVVSALGDATEVDDLRNRTHQLVE